MTMQSVYQQVAAEELDDLRDEFGPNNTDKQEIEVSTGV